MDDMSPEIRMVVEAVRSPRLTRAHKARLWSRLEQRLDEPARSSAPKKSERVRFVAPALARHALAGACLLLLALDIEGPSARAPQQALSLGGARAMAARAAPATRIVGSPHTGAKPAVEAAVATKRVSSSRRAPARPVAPEPVPRTTAPPELVAVAAVSLAEEQLLPVRPARTRFLAIKTKPVAASSSRVEGVPADFRNKLVAENLARYQAAIAEQARIASIRRPLSSIGGYAAW